MLRACALLPHAPSRRPAAPGGGAWVQPRKIPQQALVLTRGWSTFGTPSTVVLATVEHFPRRGGLSWRELVGTLYVTARPCVGRLFAPAREGRVT